MSAVLTKAWAEVRRRRVQSVLVAVLVMFASTTITIGLTLVRESANPFDRAFEEQKGAYLQVRFQSGRVTPDQLRDTPTKVGASAAAGPWPVVALTVKHGDSRYPLNLVGRDGPAASVSILRMAGGRWAERPGEVVIPRSFADFNHIAIGDQLVTLHTPSKPVLTVVGEAVDIDQGSAELGNSQWAWVIPAQVSALADPSQEGEDLQFLMLYRFPGAPVQEGLRQALDQLRAAVPPGALVSSLDYFLVRQVYTGIDLFAEVFLITFGLLALAVSVATIANLVVGIVIASFREIGIMKSIGFTPGQVVASLEAQMLIPTLAGCAAGIPLGMALSLPLVDVAARTLGIPSDAQISPLIGLAALAGVLLAVAASALLPARRVGRLSAVTAIAAGSAPTPERPGWLIRGIHGIGIPLPIRLGLGLAVVRPGRTVLALIGVVVGVSALVFAYTTPRYIATLPPSNTLAQPGEISIQRLAAFPGDQEIMADIDSQPQTRAVIAVASTHVVVPGVTNPVIGIGFRGEATGRVPLVRGRWYRDAGEVVAPLATISDAHLQIGDYFTGKVDGRSVQLHLVGEVVNFVNLGHDLFFDWTTLLEMTPKPQTQSYVISLHPGSDAGAAADAIRRLEPDALSVSIVRENVVPPVVTLIYLVAVVLALLMAAVGASGVFVSILLNTQERVRDLGILRSIGMTPGQVVRMVLASATSIGLVGGILGLPAGALGAHGIFSNLLTHFGGNDLPANAAGSVFGAAFPSLALTGVAIAGLGAVLPGRWAARKRVADVMRSE